jgi:hypothetical protein
MATSKPMGIQKRDASTTAMTDILIEVQTTAITSEFNPKISFIAEATDSIKYSISYLISKSGETLYRSSNKHITRLT